MTGRLVAIVMLVAASPLLAQDDYLYGRVRYAEPGVTIQQGSEGVASEAEANLPLLPGDRVWTDGGGRAEFQFADGSLLRLDARSKLEYISAEEGSPSVLRLHSGSLFLHVLADDPGFEVETPGGLVTTLERGVYRVDADGDEVGVSVYQGEASLASGRGRVGVREGEQCYARRGRSPEEPQGLGRDEDAFARWDQGREGRASWASQRREYVPP
jgi:ferric-dicitrate binding protein FerR (iron transport regulator)